MSSEYQQLTYSRALTTNILDLDLGELVRIMRQISDQSCFFLPARPAGTSCELSSETRTSCARSVNQELGVFPLSCERRRFIKKAGIPNDGKSLVCVEILQSEVHPDLNLGY